ncbi:MULTISPECIES: ATP-binding protein [Bizionia]|uniref:histidine kinase n=1 Tax=Bizionia algoritergicola TaxID=291187 RepID=A0A5D0QZR0_9FLAO|nr:MULTISPECIES: ATP-binding protein [Bizionia]OBX23093.1 sensor histidine kinase [Bizionia sp. APA-3]TYB74753.1 PAS domain-containing protein [Bizionia algoritergicola]
MSRAITNIYSVIQSEALLGSLDSHLIISISDAFGKLVYCNSNFSKVMNVSEETGVGQINHLLKSPMQSEAILAGETWRGVLFHKGQNSKNYWLDTTIEPIKNEKGDVIKYLTISSDISNYYCKGINKNPVHCTEERLINNFTEDVLYINKFGKIINTSINTLNNAHDSIIGSYIYDFVNPVNHDYIKKQVDTVFSHGKDCKYQSMGLSTKGNQTFFVSKLKPVFNVENEIIYATLKSKKYKNTIKVNDELKAIETKHSNIFQSINVGILVVANGMGNIIEWNKGAELAFGYLSSEIIGKPLTVLISKKQVDTGVKELLKAKDKLDNDSYGDNIEMLGLRKNGDEFPVEFAMSNWQNGKEKFYCAFMLDISKRKNLEEKLKQTTKDLELFLYRSAHDLKAPLTSAEGLLHLLKEEKLNNRTALLVNMLDETLEKGRLLLDDLAFASIISEKRRDNTVIDFQKKINNALLVLKGIKNFDNITFHVDIQQGTDFYFNQELMDSILQNLIHNTICFAKSKTNKVVPTTHINIKSIDKKVCITVSDNGVGIREDDIDKVFDLYFKANSDNSEGTGLGLYIVKRIVEDFNGDIEVKSKINEGTTFEVQLPNLKEGSKNND